MNEQYDIAALQQTISELFSTQKLALLSSFGDGQPYASLVHGAIIIREYGLPCVTGI